MVRLTVPAGMFGAPFGILRDGRGNEFNVGALPGKLYCLSTRCECPPGSVGVLPATHELLLPAHIGLSGGLGTGRVVVQGVEYSRYCHTATGGNVYGVTQEDGGFDAYTCDGLRGPWHGFFDPTLTLLHKQPLEFTLDASYMADASGTLDLADSLGSRHIEWALRMRAIPSADPRTNRMEFPVVRIHEIRTTPERREEYDVPNPWLSTASIVPYLVRTRPECNASA
jgi:hypothetical protein